MFPGSLQLELLHGTEGATGSKHTEILGNYLALFLYMWLPIVGAEKKREEVELQNVGQRQHNICD